MEYLDQTGLVLAINRLKTYIDKLASGSSSGDTTKTGYITVDDTVYSTYYNTIGSNSLMGPDDEFVDCSETAIFTIKSISYNGTTTTFSSNVPTIKMTASYSQSTKKWTSSITVSGSMSPYTYSLSPTQTDGTMTRYL